MRSQILPLLQNEIVKAARRKVTWFGFLLEAVGCLIVYLIGGQISNAQSANGWGYLGFSMQLVFTDIGPIFIIVFSAMLVSEEMGTGTIRAALAAPVHRWELYVAKAGVGLLYALMLSVVALLISAALASMHFQFGAVADSAGVVYDQGHAAREFLTAWALSWIPLAALVMYGLLISTLIRSPGAAVATGTSTFFLIEFTKHIAGFDPYIFTRYIAYAWVTLGSMAQGMDYQWTPEVWKMIELCAVSAGVTFGAGLVIFVRRDLNH